MDDETLNTNSGMENMLNENAQTAVRKTLSTTILDDLFKIKKARCDDEAASESAPSITDSVDSFSGRCSPTEQDAYSSGSGSRGATPNNSSSPRNRPASNASPSASQGPELTREAESDRKDVASERKPDLKLDDESNASNTFPSTAQNGLTPQPHPCLADADSADRCASYFACSNCPKFFLTEPSLKHHNSLYHSEKSFLCEICKKAFRFRSNLAEHRSVHTSLKPYVCKFCGKSSRLKGNLTKHILKHHKKEQTDFIGKDDIIIRKGKKSIKDPAAVDFLEKSMIVLSPDSVTQTSSHPYGVAKNGDKIGLKRRKNKSRGRIIMQHALLDDSNEKVFPVKKMPSSENLERCQEKPFVTLPYSNAAATSVASPGAVSELTINRFADPVLTSMLNQKSGAQAAATPMTSAAARLFPTLPTAAALAATSLLPPNHLSLISLDHLLMALNPVHHQLGSSPNASNPIKKFDQLSSSIALHPDMRKSALINMQPPSVQLHPNADQTPSKTRDNGQIIAIDEERALLSSYSPSGCASSVTVSSTKCESCGKHFRKSTNLAAHLANKHCRMVEMSNGQTVCQEQGASLLCDGDAGAALPLTSLSRIGHSRALNFPTTPCKNNNNNNNNSQTNSFAPKPPIQDGAICSLLSSSSTGSASRDKSFSRDLRDIKDVLNDVRRQLRDNMTFDPALASFDARIGRLEHQVEVSLATLYSLVQMQTEMNLSFFQFKADIFEQLRSLQNTIKTALSPND